MIFQHIGIGIVVGLVVIASLAAGFRRGGRMGLFVFSVALATALIFIFSVR